MKSNSDSVPVVKAIVIARGGSTRLPNKNMLDFHGSPLVAHKVAQLRQCPSIREIVVGSDSMDILKAAIKAGAVAMERKPEFCDEKSRSWNEVIHDMVSRVQADIIVWAHCTNPCVLPATYETALQSFLASSKVADSLVSVTQFRNHVWWQDKPLNFNPWGAKHQPAAELDPVYYQNGAIFIAWRALMLQESYVYGRYPMLFEIGAEEAVDIDTEKDFARALSVYRP